METRIPIDINQLAAENADLRKQIEAIVSENKQLALHLQQVKGKSWSASWELNFSTKEVAWSDEMYDFMGVPRETHPDMRIFQEQLSSIGKDKLNGAIKKVVLTQEDYSFEHLLKRHDGKELTARTDLKIRFDDKKNLPGCLDLPVIFLQLKQRSRS